MKVLASIILLASVVLAEPPFYRQQQNRQYYFARQQEEASAAPYPPSGFKPAGPAFNLPQRQVENPQQKYGPPAAATTPQQQYGTPAKPQQQYGAPNEPQRKYGPPATPQQQYGSPSESQRQYSTPQQQYGPPQQQYGPPQEPTTTEVPNTTELDDATTVSGITESESEPVNAVNELEEDDLDQNQPQQTGEYYIALPDGRLQRVRYVSRQDVEAMKYFAKIRAENVEPLRGPIYAYAPLQKLQIVPAGLQIALASPVVSPAVQTPQPEKIKIEPAKLEIEPVAAQVQYQYDSPSAVLPLPSSPLSSSYAAYTGNYQIPENRYLLTVQ
ncbi:PREDICTED: probable basic-leucine zipper transcription factor I [Polistes dominula]|uniref:Probable basic-leucine zipper transcription factor I n=1 Tax=Polistes dominula TaxID=743375 RepID=A0ABM1JGW8_POLDO|nr:PREDICTED: probable basic-leucine zipper transcription factor I [Polistes dominula]